MMTMMTKKEHPRDLTQQEILATGNWVNLVAVARMGKLRKDQMADLLVKLYSILKTD